jgi:hypothetical protein
VFTFSEIVISECPSRAVVCGSVSAENCLWKSRLEMEIGKRSHRIFNIKDNSVLLSLNVQALAGAVLSVQ